MPPIKTQAMTDTTTMAAIETGFQKEGTSSGGLISSSGYIEHIFSISFSSIS